MSGVRASVLVLAGVGVTNLSNYLFNLLSARHLGPSSYGDIASLTAVSGIITLPLAGAQVFVARHVAAIGSRGRPLNDGNYVSGFAGAVVVTGGLVTLVLVACSPLIQSALSIKSLTAVILTVLVTAPSFLLPVLVGAIQGSQRFLLFSVAMAAPSVLRLLLAVAALAAGLGVPGVMAATLVATVFSLVIPLAAVRHSLGSRAGWRPRLPGPEALALLPVVAGMLAMTCLSTDDLVTAKVVFSAHEAGLYSSASLIGRVILYLPAAIVTVLLPKVSARVSAADATGQILAGSFLATAAFCVPATAIYAADPRLIMRIAFGSSYQGAASLLWMFGIAMTIYALLTVLLAYRVGQGETRTCWLLLGGAVVQAGLFVAFHSSPRELLAVSIFTGSMLLFASSSGALSQARLSLRGGRHA